LLRVSVAQRSVSNSRRWPLEEAAVSLFVVEDRDHHVLGDVVDAVGLLDDPVEAAINPASV